jgi:mannan endo-1,4-beta-mannosidase
VIYFFHRKAGVFMRFYVKKIAFIFFMLSIYSAVSAANITINTANQRIAISPYIYGTNQQMEGDENLTIMRLGGNRMTGLNWETNASNAGSDYQQSSDNYMCTAIEYPLSTTECAGEAGGIIEHFVDYNIAHGYKSILTLPMAGYVAADENGTVSVAETAPSARWDTANYVKGSPFIYPPNLTDGAVYDDEEVAYMVQKYGNAETQNGVMAYQLDNEPDLWSSTHPRIHPAQIGAAELVTRCAELASSIKNVDQYAQVFGPVFGMIWSEDSLGSDWAALKSAGGYSWYVDYFLDQMNKASTTAGKRLLDALDIHYYTESAEGLYPPFSYSTGCRVTEDGCTSTAAATSRMQAARTLWDSTFTENSSVGQWLSAAS